MPSAAISSASSPRSLTSGIRASLEAVDEHVCIFAESRKIGLDRAEREEVAVNLIAKKFPNAALINGKWVTSNKTFSVLDPATGEEITTVPNLGAEDTTRA